MIDSDWLNDPKFKNIPERKKKFLIEMMKKMKGKSMNEAMSVYIKTSAIMKKEGLSLSKEEANLMIGCLIQNMSPEEASKWNHIKTMLKL